MQGEGLFSVRHTPITFRDQEKGEKMTLTLRGIGLKDIFHEEQRLNLPSFHCYFLLKNKESSNAQFIFQSEHALNFWEI